MNGIIELKPGSQAPISGTYRCWFCSPEGLKEIADALLGRPSLTALAGMKRPEVDRVFQAGTIVDECPNCGPATLWRYLNDKLYEGGGLVITSSEVRVGTTTYQRAEISTIARIKGISFDSCMSAGCAAFALLGAGVLAAGLLGSIGAIMLALFAAAAIPYFAYGLLKRRGAGLEITTHEGKTIKWCWPLDKGTPEEKARAEQEVEKACAVFAQFGLKPQDRAVDRSSGEGAAIE